MHLINLIGPEAEAFESVDRAIRYDRWLLDHGGFSWTLKLAVERLAQMKAPVRLADGFYRYKDRDYARFCDVPVWPNLHAPSCRCGACPK